MDEFVIKSLQEYEGKKFINVADEKMDLDTEEEKESLQKPMRVIKTCLQK